MQIAESLAGMGTREVTLIGGEASGSSLADKLKVPYSLLDALVQHARVEKLVEVRGMSGVGSAGYRYVLTDLGRDRAGQYSVRVNGQWRICFTWANGGAGNVELVDYH